VLSNRAALLILFVRHTNLAHRISLQFQAFETGAIERAATRWAAFLDETAR
jgi:hypothetical protein